MEMDPEDWYLLLTEQQQLFVNEYLKGLGAREAAERAGYTVRKGDDDEQG